MTMNSNVILRVYESGGVDDWEWVCTLTKVELGRFSCRLEQEVGQPHDESFENIFDDDQIRNGAQLFEFIWGSWNSEHEESLPENDWKDLIDEIAGVDTELAEQFAKAIQDEFDPEDEPVDEDELALARFIASATYEPKRLTGMWANLAERQRGLKAIRYYVQQYQATHGALPQGTHRIAVTFGERRSGADLSPPSMGLMKISDSGSFDADVTFPTGISN